MLCEGYLNLHLEKDIVDNDCECDTNGECMCYQLGTCDCDDDCVCEDCESVEFTCACGGNCACNGYT